MSNKIYTFNNPAEFTYDSDKIEVSDGKASLKTQQDPNIYAHYHLNEATGATVIDSSGNGRNGSPINNPVSVECKLNNCLSFNGSNQYVDCGNIGDFTTDFSVDCWVNLNSSMSLSKYYAIAYHGDIYLTGWGLHYYGSDKKIQFWIKSPLGYTLISSPVLSYNTWYHIVGTWNSSSGELKLYYNGSPYSSDTSAIIPSTGYKTIIGDCILSSATLPYKGLIDEAVIYDKELTQEEVTERYNSGIGTETPLDVGYPIDKPTIKPKTAWIQSGLSSFSKFLETLGGGNQGQIAYQLSDDEGVNWRYWDGGNWVVSESLYNTAQVVNSTIGDFPITNEKILFRAFLISDGNQQCELDTIELNSIVGYPPYIECGSDRECYDHETIKPFYYAMINDPDGDINNASAYYKIESETWINLPKGEYATLQEAVRNLTYEFNNIGNIECRLKIIDEQGKPSEDYLTMTVKKYTVAFNVKDKDGNHLPNLQVSFGDGTDWATKNSPFVYDYEWKSTTYKVIIDKVGFQPANIYVPSTTHTEDVTLSILGAVSPSEVADAIWDELRSGHVVSGSFGKAVQEELTSIKSETDKIQTIDDNVDTVKIETNKIQPEIINKKSEYKANVSKLDNVETIVKKVLGLSQSNYKLEDIIYASGQLQTAKIKTYTDSSLNSLLAQYQITCQFNENGTYKSYEVKQI